MSVTDAGANDSMDSVAFTGGQLEPYRHVCAFVNSRDEERRILDPFVSEGLARGEKTLYLIDAAKFGADFVIDVLRTHPMALIGGVLQVHPFCVPPAEFLEEVRSRGGRGPDV